MFVEGHHSQKELRGYAKRETDARLRIRLQVIILAQQGYTAPQIVEALGVSRRPLQEYVRRYNRDGLAGLDAGGRGRRNDPGRPSSGGPAQRVGQELIGATGRVCAGARPVSEVASGHRDPAAGSRDRYDRSH